MGTGCHRANDQTCEYHPEIFSTPSYLTNLANIGLYEVAVHLIRLDAPGTRCSIRRFALRVLLVRPERCPVRHVLPHHREGRLGPSHARKPRVVGDDSERRQDRAGLQRGLMLLLWVPYTFVSRILKSHLISYRHLRTFAETHYSLSLIYHTSPRALAK